MAPADDLRRERDALAHMRESVPALWALLDDAIARAETPCTPTAPRSPASGNTSAMASPTVASPAARTFDGLAPMSPSMRPTLNLSHALGGMSLEGPVSAPPGAYGMPYASPRAGGGRKRVKLPVPADKYPEYNFVGRLLGPRGTTLKTLERDSGCKIMIRGKGSIRKDKEADVRGKPGWEHVFNEPLHVVIEVSEMVDDADAVRALIRAKEAVELLLVPVPEERDGLKRQQLRDLAILNGTFRGAGLQSGFGGSPHPLHQVLPGSPGMPPRMCQSASLLPSSTVSGSSIHSFGPHPLLAASSGRSGRSVPQSGCAPMPLHGVPGGAVPSQQQGYVSERPSRQRGLASASSSCTVTSSPPPMGSAWGSASGGSIFPLDSLGHGFLGESAASSSSRLKTPASAPAPRADFTSCSSMGEDDSHGSSCANSLESEEALATGNLNAVSPNSSTLGLVFMGSDFYNGAFANNGAGNSSGSSQGSGGQSGALEEEMPVSALSRRAPWANSSKSKSPESPRASSRQVSFASSSRASSSRSSKSAVEQQAEA